MFGKHAAYIIPSYALTAILILGLIVWIVMVYRARLKEIAELENRGIRRGAGQGGGDSGAIKIRQGTSDE